MNASRRSRWSRRAAAGDPGWRPLVSLAAIGGGLERRRLAGEEWAPVFDATDGTVVHTSKTITARSAAADLNPAIIMFAVRRPYGQMRPIPGGAVTAEYSVGSRA